MDGKEVVSIGDVPEFVKQVMHAYSGYAGCQVVLEYPEEVLNHTQGIPPSQTTIDCAWLHVCDSCVLPAILAGLP